MSPFGGRCVRVMHKSASGEGLNGRCVHLRHTGAVR